MVNKYSEQTRLAAVKDYFDSHDGYKVVAARQCVHPDSLRKWIAGYRIHGAAALKTKRDRRFSLEFKLSVLTRMREKGLSLRQVAALFNITRHDMIGQWKRQYDEGGLEALSPRFPGGHTTLPKPQLPLPLADEPRTSQQLLEELQQLRMENAYLKKLDAFVRANKPSVQGKKR